MVVAGTISFTGAGTAAAARWAVQPARDSHTSRLVLFNQQRNEVMGYIQLLFDGNRITLAASARPPRFFSGALEWKPEIAFGNSAYACRSVLPPNGTVVQMASGPADSLLNDSLFDPERDLLLRFAAERVSIASQPPKFQIHLMAAISDEGNSNITLEAIPDYFRDRYVPNYRLIDRKRCPRAPAGFMSWNSYFEMATENDNLNDARVAAQTLKPFGMEFWQIEAWQDNSYDWPVRNYRNLTLKPEPKKFPHGMKWLAGQIRLAGFRPGIWTVPWGTGDDDFYREHREWFLHDAKGQPFQNWAGRYMLDASLPEVRRFMEETHRVMSADWGYEFFKIDGISFAVRMFEREDVRAAFHQPCAEPFRLSMEALRRGIGADRILLVCAGHYMGPEVAYADASRIGGDLVARNEKPSWTGYLSQARATLAQLFTHNLIWYNDPDTLMVGEAAPMSMARVATTIVALPGQLTFVSDKIDQLPSARLRLIQQALPVCDVRPLDLVPILDLRPIWDLKLRRSFGTWDVVSIFNWNDEKRDYKLLFADIGLDAGKDYLVYEFWSGAFWGLRRGSIEAHVEPHANVLLAIHEHKNNPQILSSDRHITQGGVELAGVVWDEDHGELVSRLRLVEKDVLTLSVYVPDRYEFRQAVANDAVVTGVGGDGPVKFIRIRRDTSGEASLAISFVRRTAAK